VPRLERPQGLELREHVVQRLFLPAPRLPRVPPVPRTPLVEELLLPVTLAKGLGTPCYEHLRAFLGALTHSSRTTRVAPRQTPCVVGFAFLRKVENSIG